ncbi:S66 family peptidase [Spirochaeta africana]|nr:S66 peptidase family protein [Spirochaeta africana]
MIKPQRLQSGDTIALVSPSWGGPSYFPDVFDNGVRCLQEDFGLRVREFPTARMPADTIYQHPELRARDINDAFADPKVRGIITSIGGDDSIRILPFLDLDAIKANPKLIMGYSDSTAFLAYLNLHGLVTFHGPSVMAGFSYLRNFPEAMAEYQQVLLQNQAISLRPFPQWADSYQPWGPAEHIGQVAELRSDDIGHRWIQHGAKSSGRLWGGNIEVLEMMKATLAWPAPDFWQNRVLFLETSEDKPSPVQVGFMLRNYGMQGVFNAISGLLVARPKGYTSQEKAELDQEILRIVAGEFGADHLNIITNLDLGHTDPRHILPYGIPIELDPGTETLQLLEPPFV